MHHIHTVLLYYSVPMKTDHLLMLKGPVELVVDVQNQKHIILYATATTI